MLEEIQIKRLESYCIAQGIRHYDVQLELVDHMAEWIEHAMEQEQLSFEETYNRMQAAFTKTELQFIFSNKKKALKNRISRMYIKEWLSFFTLPKILITACLYALIFRLPASITGDKIIAVFIHLTNLYVLLYRRRNSNFLYNKGKQKVLPLLSLTTISFIQAFTVMLMLLQIGIYIFGGLAGKHLPVSVNFVFRIIYPAYLVMVVSFEHATLALNKQVRSLYPQAFSA